VQLIFLSSACESPGRGSGRGPGDDILLRQFPSSPLKKSRWPGNLPACLAAELAADLQRSVADGYKIGPSDLAS
jgi:hypothetical protein